MKIYEVLENPDEDDTLFATISLQDAHLAEAGLLTQDGERLAWHISNFSRLDLVDDDNLAMLLGVIIRTVWGEDAFRALAALPTTPRYDNEE